MNQPDPPSTLRVLLVEDNAYDRDAFRRVLRNSEFPFELSECVRAEDGLHRLEEQEGAFDLVVSDHNLPGMNGLEFCREILRRKLPLPTILLTGGGSEHLAVEALKSGVNDYLMKDPDGGYLRLLPVVLPDVVHQHRERLLRQQAEAALRASEEQFRHAFEYTAVGMALAAVDGRFWRVNRALCDMLGYTDAQMLAIRIADITHADDWPALQQAFQHALAGEQISFRLENRYWHQHGRLLWGYLSVTLLRDEAGAPLRFILQLQDVTERKRMEDELRQERALLADRVSERTEALSKANAELSRAVRLKDEFLAIMSHELRTPLNVVLGMSSALLEGGYGDLPDDQHTAVERIESNGRHLLHLITDILDLSEIGAGRWEVSKHPFQVESVCQAALRLLNHTLHHKQLTVITRFDSAAATLYADERRVKQMLVHLISNASKFTPEGGRIGISTEGALEEGTLSFSVWDTGIGMPREGMERLFLPFTQADSSLARRYDGAGVGLSLIYHIVHMHGGSLLVESVEHQGSRLTATFPWRADTAGQPPARPATESAQAPKQRCAVLAGTYEPDLQRLAAYLAAHGWRPTLARNGREVLQRIEEEPAALVILAEHLPQADTEGLVRQIRQNYRELPVLMMTDLELPGNRERYLQVGVTRYWRKPVHERRLDEFV